MDRVTGYIATHYDGKIVEVGVGENPTVAQELRNRGFTVVVTDIEERSHDGFILDDVTDPDPSIYNDASLVYSIRPPPELHKPLKDVAARAGADLLIAPFGNEESPLNYELINHRGRVLYLLKP